MRRAFGFHSARAALALVLGTFGLLVERYVPREGRFDRLTDAGRATALEVLRQRATGPRHRLLDGTGTTAMATAAR